MKNLENYGVQELNAVEQRELHGGDGGDCVIVTHEMEGGHSYFAEYHCNGGYYTYQYQGVTYRYCTALYLAMANQ